MSSSATAMFQHPASPSRRARGPVWHAVGRGAYAVEAQPDTVHTTGVLTEAVFQSRTVAGSPALLARLVANEAALKALLTLSAAPVKFGAASSTTLKRRAEFLKSWEAQLDSVYATSRLVCPCSCQQCLFNQKARDRLLHGVEAAAV